PTHNSVQVFEALASSASYSDYRAAIGGFGNPASNIAYANQDGDIALTVTGRFPLRKPQQGRFIQDGRQRKNAWAGFIPFSHVPVTHNPARGFVASANQRSTDLSYPYYYLGSFDDYRGRYLNRILDTFTQATVADMQALQFDSYSLKAEELVPLLLRSLDSTTLSADEQRAKSTLADWDYRFTGQSRGAVVFQHFLDSLYQLTFDEVWLHQQEERHLLQPETWRLIDLLRNQPDHFLLDRLATPATENADSLLRQAFRRAVVAAQARNWNEMRATRIQHLARIEGLGTPILYTDGARDTPNALSSSMGPSWRMVVSLEQPVRAWGILPGGASGNPGSPNYDAGIEEWAQGAYHVLPFWSGPDDPAVDGPEKIVLQK
ncbi:MAG: hypothetical protein D6772_02205, partial [Bacteroidetes bacterium]